MEKDRGRQGHLQRRNPQQSGLLSASPAWAPQKNEKLGLTQNFHFLEELEEVTRDRRETLICDVATLRELWGWRFWSLLFQVGRSEEVCACKCVHVCEHVLGDSRTGEVWKHCCWLALALHSNCRLLCHRELDLEYDSKMRAESGP